MDRVWECLVPKVYNKDEVIINKGENSTFMIVLYNGEVGIYLQTAEELNISGKQGKWISTK